MSNPTPESPAHTLAHLSERYLQDKIHEIAQDLREAADTVQRKCLPHTNTDPAAAASTAISVVTTAIYNMQLEKLPRAAANLIELRGRAARPGSSTDLRAKLIAAMTYDHDEAAAQDCIDNIMAIVEAHGTDDD